MPSTSPGGGRRRGRAGLAVLALLVCAACTARAEGRRLPPTSTTAAPATTTTAAPPPFPLTGLPSTDPAHLGRQALVVKIENHPAARPQSGLDAADVVYEEQVEGGLTRFIAVFQSH